MNVEFETVINGVFNALKKAYLNNPELNGGRDFREFLAVDKVRSTYKFWGVEQVRRLGLDPKSPAGLEIIKGEKPVLVDFHADWCNPCKMMNPTLKSIKKHFGDDIKILKINVDKNEKVTGKFQVRGIPTFILFKQGEIKWRKSGVIEEKEFINTISSNI